MDFFDRDDLRKLIQRPDGWCISIYMPAQRTFPETKQNPIRFKNLLREADARLTQVGLRSPGREALLKPARTLVKQGHFWRHQSLGLAAFISSQGIQHYRLPLEFDELLVVTDRFHIKPLLPLLSNERRFYILALSQNEVSLFQCTPQDIEEVPLEGIPNNLPSALEDNDSKKQLQLHTQSPRGSGNRAVLFSGFGSGSDDAKLNILKYFNHVEQGVHSILNQEQVPLVLAGVDYLFPIYKETNRYPHLLEQGIPGNPEGLKSEDLLKQAWNIVEPIFLDAQEGAKIQYVQASESKQTADTLEEIVPGAYNGRINTLFVAVGIQQWGTFDPENHRVHPHLDANPGDEDLLDFAAVHTFLNGGTVYALRPEEMPNEKTIAAICRY
jgi:hypothetical protein